MQKINLLDCTLRDGGYINDWKFGYRCIKEIILNLVRANTDIVEVGFLRNVENDKNVTRWDTVEELKKILPNDCRNTKFAAMALHNFYDIDKLADYDGKSVDLIRVTFHDYDIKEGLKFCSKVKEKGYQVSCNPINIMGYTDHQVLGMLEQINMMKPEAFSIVDTFGSMNAKDLDRLVSLVDHNLSREIALGLHLHENMAQSYSLAQKFVDKHLNRKTIIDGSLMGMGRVPGNLSIELMAHYLNENFDKQYEIDYMLEAIENHILPIREKESWGYTPAYFLSAKYNLHRNYAEHYLNKGNLTQKDINHLLSRIKREKKTVFDSDYAEELYDVYMNNKIDDSEAIREMEKVFAKKTVVLVAPGASLNTMHDEIQNFIRENQAIVVSVNFIPENLDVDFTFFSNNKRYNKVETNNKKVIITSNLSGEAIYKIDYNRLSVMTNVRNNSLLMLLKLLSELNTGQIFIAGADGYSKDEKSYYDDLMGRKIDKEEDYNCQIADAIRKLGFQVKFITPSRYEQYL